MYITLVDALFFFLEAYLKLLRNLVVASISYQGYVKSLTWLLLVGNLAQGVP